eukprot:g2814.t1
MDGPRLFVCLFDAHTTHEAAAFSVSHCYDIFLSCLIDSKTNPVQAIQQTFKELDKQFLDSTFSSEIRAVSGCSGVIMYLDLSRSKGWIGNVGTAQCLMGISEGAFNAQQTDANVISELHNLQNLIEKEHLKERFPTDADLFKTIDGDPYMKGITRLSRTIGYGFAKDPQLASKIHTSLHSLQLGLAIYNETSRIKLNPLPTVENPYVLCEPQVMEIDLSENAENLVLYSEGIGQLLSPTEIAVFTNVFNKCCLSQLTETIRGLEFSTNGNSSTRSQDYMESLRCPSSALIRYAVSKAADEIDALMNVYHKSRNNDGDQTQGRDRWDIEHVRSLKVKDPQSITNNPNLEDHLISRGDLMKNLSCVVISLDKTSTRRSPAIPMNILSSKPKVQYGWTLLQCYCKFHIQRRRSCLRHWWLLIAAVIRDAQRRILREEKEKWIKQEIEILNESEGEVSSSFDDSPAAQRDRTKLFPCTMSPEFRKWLTTSAFDG